MTLSKANSPLSKESVFLIGKMLLMHFSIQLALLLFYFTEYHLLFSFDVDIPLSFSVVFFNMLNLMSWTSISNFSHCVFQASYIQVQMSVVLSNLSWKSQLSFSSFMNYCSDYSSYPCQTLCCPFSWRIL